jgi:hypothetical protein
MIWSFYSVIDIDYSLLEKYTWLKNSKSYRELDVLCSEKSRLGGICMEPVGREALRRAHWKQGKCQGLTFVSGQSKNKTVDPIRPASSHIFIL